MTFFATAHTHLVCPSLAFYLVWYPLNPHHTTFTLGLSLTVDNWFLPWNFEGLWLDRLVNSSEPLSGWCSRIASAHWRWFVCSGVTVSRVYPSRPGGPRDIHHRAPYSPKVGSEALLHFLCNDISSITRLPYLMNYLIQILINFCWLLMK